ncbi:MAG TPA: 3-hydroxybutyryl-CoA dehydrogenase [Rubrobacteraceae bacterium]|nr:3-hydroxybutyryl-CoA dehydrogenase [Rubrobacteraceae bacterium]
MAVEKIQVVGAGQMGSGIAQVAAQAGLAVHLADVDEAALDGGLETIKENLSRSVEKERISQGEMDEALDRIESGTEYAADADLAIEAVVEVAEVKREVFQALDEMLGEDAILASNTSSISITELAATTGRPERFIGMHFFNPVPLMKLVEIVRGLQTSDETHREVHELAECLGKEPVQVNDSPGFVSNRILMPMINEAVYCVMEGAAGPDEVDAVMKLGMNHPMGPLELADLIGLDTCLHIMEVLHEGFGDTKYRPCPVLKRYVAAGWLGRKSGKGFYEYA